MVVAPSSDEDFKSSLGGGCSTGDDEQSDVNAASPYLVPHTFGDTGPLGNAWDNVSEHSRTRSSCVYAGRVVHVFLLGRLLDDSFDLSLEDALPLSSIGSFAFESDSLSERTSTSVSSHSVSVDPSSKYPSSSVDIHKVMTGVADLTPCVKRSVETNWWNHHIRFPGGSRGGSPPRV